MKKIYNAAVFYALVGLVSGLFYREYTKAADFEGFTQLGLIHTHVLALGFMFMLAVLALEKLFELSKTKWFNLFYWHYNGGLVLTVVMMLIIGMRQVAGTPSNGMFDGMAGLGHIIITVGIGFFLVALGQRISSDKK